MDLKLLLSETGLQKDLNEDPKKMYLALKKKTAVITESDIDDLNGTHIDHTFKAMQSLKPLDNVSISLLKTKMNFSRSYIDPTDRDYFV